MIAAAVLLTLGAARAAEPPACGLRGSPAPLVELLDEVVGDADRASDGAGDGVPDEEDAFPSNPYEQRDMDNDGLGDDEDAFPADPSEQRDSDCDGLGDEADDSFDGPVSTEVQQAWTDGVYGWTARFQLEAVGEGEHRATLRLHLEGRRDAAREARWEGAIEDMWSSDELELDVIFVDEASAAHSTVTVKPGEGWTNTSTWFAAESPTAVAHEVGHHLGLFDEYPDPEVPRRFVGPDDSIMRSVDPREHPRTYPWHEARIRSLFACP